MCTETKLATNWQRTQVRQMRQQSRAENGASATSKIRVTTKTGNVEENLQPSG